jgi:hypothetical protein
MGSAIVCAELKGFWSLTPDENRKVLGLFVTWLLDINFIRSLKSVSV